MTPNQVKEYYGSLYRFSKATGMAHGSLSNWVKWGYVPFPSQCKLEKLTDGALNATFEEDKDEQA